MIVQVANTNTPPRNLLRSTGAVLAGMVAVIALSLGTDQLLHVLEVYPPWGQAMYEPGLNILALSYRCVYNVVGACITARLAPRNPLRHLDCRRPALGYPMRARSLAVARAADSSLELSCAARRVRSTTAHLVQQRLRLRDQLPASALIETLALEGGSVEHRPHLCRNRVPM